MNAERWITIIVGISAILAAIDSGIQRYNKAATSKYAAQRDFEHLRKNQEQFKENLKVILNENDELTKQLIQVRTQLETLIAIQRER